MTAAGEPLRDSEVVSYLLNGINSEYESFVISVTTRATHINSAELLNFILTFESCASLTTTIQHGLLPTPYANITTSLPYQNSTLGRNTYRGGRMIGPYVLWPMANPLAMSTTCLPAVPTMPIAHAMGQPRPPRAKTCHGPHWPCKALSFYYFYLFIIYFI